MTGTDINRLIFKYLKYGNYGAPGWSGGKWTEEGEVPDFSIPPAADYLDSCFMEHDKAFNDPAMDNAKDIITANLVLIASMLYGILKYTVIVGYMIAAVIGFSIMLLPTLLYFVVRKDN